MLLFMGFGVEIRLRYLTCWNLPVKKEPIHLRIQEGKLSDVLTVDAARQQASMQYSDE